MSADYEQGSLSLFGTVAMGTGVMIGAGIFALTGQVAELAGPWFPAAFLLAAVVSGFSAYSYIRVTHAHPSAGGIATILHDAYGDRAVTGAAALLMALSMIINESLVARTFGTYTMQLVGGPEDSLWVPALGVGLIGLVFLVNLLGNDVIGNVAKVTSGVKVLGILGFVAAALLAADFDFRPLGELGDADTGVGSFVAAVAISILAFKGFTTITNSGAEVVEPSKNVGRAIAISLAVCLVVYLLVCWGVGSSLSVEEIVQARDYSLAEAARPALGEWGMRFTAGLAILATASGLLASVFAVSRMLAMLTEMELIPHRHFGMPGDVQKHTLVYTVVLAALCAAFLDLGRIAAVGAIFYLVMDMVIHWGVLWHLRDEVEAHRAVVLTALGLDAVALGALLWTRVQKDAPVVAGALGAIVVIYLFERFFLRRLRGDDPAEQEEAEESQAA